MGPESPEAEAWLAFIIKHVIEHYLIYITWAVVGGGLGAVLGVLMFGRGYKKRITDLEAEVRKLGGDGRVVVNVNNDGSDYAPIIQGLREEVRERDRELQEKDLELLDLRTLVGRLTPTPVPGTSATYVKLPEGSRVVVMDDDSIRVALPVSVEDHIRIADTVAAVLNPDKDGDSC